LAAQYLAALLDDTCQVDVIGSAIESEAGLRLCAELRPDAVFVDINLPGKDGVSLATQQSFDSTAANQRSPKILFNRSCLLAGSYTAKLFDAEPQAVGESPNQKSAADVAPAWTRITAIRAKKVNLSKTSLY
jgi:hypothetical protein